VLVSKCVVASDGQTRLGLNGKELRPWGAMSQSVGSKDMKMEADESAVLGAIIKQCLVKPEKT
jgi:hypothetical protein